MSEYKVIAWDFDETIGVFRYEWNKQLKPGIKKTLETLKKKNYLHFIASAAHERYVEKELGNMCLEGLFEQVFGFSSIKPDWGPKEGKFYEDVAKAAGLRKEEIPDRMIVIGDNPYDRPITIDGLVFIHHIDCYISHSSKIEQVLNRLTNADKTSFKRAFDRLHKKQDIRIKGIDKVQLSYNGNNYNNCITPTIQLTPRN